MMARLKEIAESCKVSPALVSRVLNNDLSLSVSGEVSRKITDEAKRRGYLTPRQRKNASLKRTALILAPIAPWGFEDSVLKRLCFLAREFGMVVEFFQEGRRYDGLVIAGEFSRKEIDSYASECKNILLINNKGIGDYSLDSLIMDYEASEIALVEYLVSTGRKSVGYFGGLGMRDGRVIGKKRIQGFKKALTGKGLFESKNFIVHGGMDEKSGYESVIKAENLPDVLIFSDRNYASGCLRALKERNIQRFTVTYENFEQQPSGADVDMVIFSDAALKTALKLLNERIRGERSQCLRVLMPAHLEFKMSEKEKNA